ncbi:MAG: hypothetical protein JSU83_09195 [Deltaproteobacteria bacterium]|nr:MAG: hypothetical protein JSU83_09195 [Deltaproteobacteria bacterium]
MKWLEIIEIRTVDGNSKLLESQRRKVIEKMDDEIKKQVIKAYGRATIDTDFFIHLFHDSEKVEISGSPLGLRLTSALKDFGLVNRSIWVEMHTDPDF